MLVGWMAGYLASLHVTHLVEGMCWLVGWAGWPGSLQVTHLVEGIGWLA